MGGSFFSSMPRLVKKACLAMNHFAKNSKIYLLKIFIRYFMNNRIMVYPTGLFDSFIGIYFSIEKSNGHDFQLNANLLVLVRLTATHSNTLHQNPKINIVEKMTLN